MGNRTDTRGISRLSFLGRLGTSLALLMSPLRSASAMQNETIKRVIPSSGEAIPAVGLGTWQAFNEAPTLADRERLTLVLNTFYAQGGRLIDTSPMYGNAETILGELLPQQKGWFLATKVWTRGQKAGIAQMERSLRLLRTKTIELMQIHNLVDWQRHLPTLRGWKQEGRVKYLGITHYHAGAFKELEQVLRQGNIDFIQLPFSPALTDAARRLIPAAKDLGTAVIVNRPFEGGGLFRALRQRPLPPFALDFARSWGQVFLKYILSEPGVTCAIPGTGNPKHVIDNMEAARGRLPGAAERKQIEDIARAL